MLRTGHGLRYTADVASRRLFCAIHLTDDVRRRLEAVQEALGDHAEAVRRVAPQNLHLTLHFLGDTEEERIDAVVEAMQRALAAASPFEAVARDGGCFPSARKPRVFWAGVENADGRLGRLHDALGRELVALGLDIDVRRFSPHITLGYARKRADRQALTEAVAVLAAAAREQLGPRGTPFPAASVSLVESVLGRSGPTYTDIARVDL